IFYLGVQFVNAHNRSFPARQGLFYNQYNQVSVPCFRSALQPPSEVSLPARTRARSPSGTPNGGAAAPWCDTPPRGASVLRSAAIPSVSPTGVPPRHHCHTGVPLSSSKENLALSQIKIS